MVTWISQIYLRFKVSLFLLSFFTEVHTGTRDIQGSGLLNEVCGMNIRGGSEM